MAAEYGEPGSRYPFTAPPGGSQRAERRSDGSLAVMIRRKDGSVYAEAQGAGEGKRYDAVEFRDIDARGTDMFVRVLHEVPGPVGAKGEKAICGRDSENPESFRLNGTLSWRVNLGSIPRGLNRARVIQNLRFARRTWIGNMNRCRIADRSRVSFAYKGTSNAPLARNGVSTVGWGGPTLCGGGPVLACTITYTRANAVVECDTRFNAAHRSSVDGSTAGRASDIWGIMVHETGHCIGFNHVIGNDNVMSSAFESAAEAVSDRSLGRGDANGNNRKYP